MKYSFISVRIIPFLCDSNKGKTLTFVKIEDKIII